MNYQESLDYLEQLNVFGIRQGLDRIENLLHRLGDPQHKFKSIHVTGTNGKGSVSSMLARVLTESNIKTGLFISPHLVAYTERVQIDNCMISQQDFADCLSAIRVFVEAMIEEGEECPTQFEVITSLAFLYFAMNNVEYAVIEVGLGGLLDSTNVIEPELAIITNVTLEHEQFCGGDLEGVARHKAGIIKESSSVVTAATGMPLEIIRQRAEECNADIFIMNEDFTARYEYFDGIFQHLEFSSELLGAQIEYKLKNLGLHQIENSALVIMAMHILSNNDSRFSMKALLEGLASAKWPARFELFEFMQHRIIIDGAHNPAGVKMLQGSLELYFPNTKRVFILGILKDKDIDAMLHELIRSDDKVIVTQPLSDRKLDSQVLASKIQANTVVISDDLSTAIDEALALAGADELICMTGSLYLTGELRHILIQRINDKLKQNSSLSAVAMGGSDGHS